MPLVFVLICYTCLAIIISTLETVTLILSDNLDLIFFGVMLFRRLLYNCYITK